MQAFPVRGLGVILALVLPVCGPRAADAVDSRYGELIYVPIYSSIFYQDKKRTLELAAMLSIHNIAPNQGIVVTKVDYYSTKGELIAHYLEGPIELKALETRNFVVERADTAGGTGANFLVEWRAESEVPSPVVEALMINAASSQGISFTSDGRVIERFGKAAAE